MAISILKSYARRSSSLSGQRSSSQDLPDMERTPSIIDLEIERGTMPGPPRRGSPRSFRALAPAEETAASTLHFVFLGGIAALLLTALCLLRRQPSATLSLALRASAAPAAANATRAAGNLAAVLQAA